MRGYTSFLGLVLSVIAVACKPDPGPDTLTSSSDTTAGNTTSASSTGTGTTDGLQTCVEFGSTCFVRHDLLTTRAHHLAAGDCNGDGKLDLVLDDVIAKELRILYYGTTPEDSSFSNTVKRLGGANSGERILIEDFDGDSDNDIAVLAGAPLEVFLLENGQATPSQFFPLTGETGSFIAAAFDANDDARADLVLSSYYDGVQLWLLNGGAFEAFGPTYGVPECDIAAEIAADDLDGDGLMDVIVMADDQCGDKDLGSLPPTKGVVMLGSADLTFAVSDEFWAGTTPARVRTGDFDGDGRRDFAVLNSYSDDISILLGNGDGTFAQDVRHRPVVRPARIEVGDLDGDGADELVVQGDKSVVASSFPHIPSEPIVLATEVAGPLALADLNEDGLLDIAARSPDTSSHLVLLITGTP